MTDPADEFGFKLAAAQCAAADEEHRLWFVEEYLAAATLTAARGDRAGAIGMLTAAIRELELPE